MNKKKLIRAASAAAAIAMLTVLLVGCGRDKAAPAAGTAQSDTGETDLGGVSIKTGLIKYYIYTAAVKETYSSGFSGDYALFDWGQKDSDGVRLDDKIKKTAYEEMAAKQLLAELAAKNGVALTDEEIKQGQSGIDEFEKSNGRDALLSNIAAIGLSSEDDYLELYKTEMLNQKIESDYAANPDKYVEDGVNLEDYSSADRVSVKHVLIKNKDSKFSDPKATAEEVLKKAKAGEDFNALMKEYNEDPGETESGYTFGKGEMVKEFETAAFALKCGEISDIVETQYGYHIIKRIAGMAELDGYLLSKLDSKAEEKVMKDISVKDIMTDISAAMKKAKEAANSTKGSGTAGSQNTNGANAAG